MITSVVIVYRFKGSCVVYAESSDTILVPNSKAEQQTSLNILWRLISIGISESQDKSVLVWLQPFKPPPFSRSTVKGFT